MLLIGGGIIMIGAVPPGEAEYQLDHAEIMNDNGVTKVTLVGNIPYKEEHITISNGYLEWEIWWNPITVTNNDLVYQTVAVPGPALDLTTYLWYLEYDGDLVRIQTH